MLDRASLFSFAAEQGLDLDAYRRLIGPTGAQPSSAASRPQLRRTLSILAAGLISIGLVCWVAANWDLLGRSGRFALLEAVFVLACLCALPRWRASLAASLIALFAIGGQFAYFGQTYQTGADPWQLFALWAVLALPLVWRARSQVLWLPWLGVAYTAVALWSVAYGGHRWALDIYHYPIHLAAWAANFALAAWAWTRGAASFRFAWTISAGATGLTAIVALFAAAATLYWQIGVAVLALSAAIVARRDIYALCMSLFALDAALMTRFARYLSDLHWHDEVALFFTIGFAGMALLGASVKLIMVLQPRESSHA